MQTGEEAYTKKKGGVPPGGDSFLRDFFFRGGGKGGSLFGGGGGGGGGGGSQASFLSLDHWISSFSLLGGEKKQKKELIGRGKKPSVLRKKKVKRYSGKGELQGPECRKKKEKKKKKKKNSY